MASRWSWTQNLVPVPFILLLLFLLLNLLFSLYFYLMWPRISLLWRATGERPNGQDITLAWIKRGRGINKKYWPSNCLVASGQSRSSTACLLCDKIGQHLVFGAIFGCSPASRVSPPHHRHLQCGRLASWCSFVHKGKHLQDLSVELILKRSRILLLTKSIESAWRGP